VKKGPRLSPISTAPAPESASDGEVLRCAHDDDAALSSIGESPDYVMRRGEMELNHQAVLKVYLVDSGIPTLKDSKAPFDKSLAVVIADLKQSLESYGWDHSFTSPISK